MNWIVHRFYIIAACLTLCIGVSACSQEPHRTTQDIPVAKAENKDTAEEDIFKPTRIDFAEADPVFGMIESRSHQSLNGEWRIILDPMGVGNASALGQGFGKDTKAITGMELIEYNFDTADRIRVPGDWNSQDERLFFYRGQVWYQRFFSATPKEGKRQHLYFGAANFSAQVFLNGQSIGQHVGGYVPFALEVTDSLKSGENTLIIRVDNTLGDSTIPTGRTDWWPYGGLTRDVLLVETPDAFIRNAKIELTNRSTGTVSTRIETEGYPAGATAKVELPELGISEILIIEADGQALTSFSATPDLWSPQNPKLYDVVFSVGEDKLSDRVGFRTIETRGSQIFLNGEPIKLNGISTHEEPVGVPGVAYSADHVRTILLEAKDLNANFVRAAHYPYSRYMAKLADELGLMLWEEVPVYWSIDWDNPETLIIARDQVKRLVERDWNRASVIIWSVANETQLSEARMDFLTRLIRDVRNHDKSRLVSAALLGGSRESFEKIITHLAVRGLAKGGLSMKDELIFRAIVARAGDAAPKATDMYSIVIDDPLAELVDIIAYNEYFGWYYSKFFSAQTTLGEDVLRPLMLDFIPDLRITANVDKPIHISEFGAGAKAGHRGGEALIWTEEYQAKIYRAQIKMLRNSPQVQGMTPWVLKDFRAMLRPLGGVQDYYNRKGLIDENGKRKLAFDILQDFYAGDWEE